MKHSGPPLAVFFLIFALILPPVAASAENEALPPALAPWQSWVLHGEESLSCPSRFNDPQSHVCWWPSQLTLDMGDQGGLFDLRVEAYAPTWVMLPGDAAHWPESVFGDGEPLPVVEKDGRPHVWLTSGEARIRGAFVWDVLPEMIQVPQTIGILVLKIKGREIVVPDVDANGRLRLASRENSATSEDTLTTDLFRLVEDDIPMRVVTRALLHVSGKPRELRLSMRLPHEASVMQIDSPLPARLADNGDLLVQAHPGQWDIRITERLTGPVTSLSAGDGALGTETWSFKAYNHLRMVKIGGAPAIEPSRTRMPDEWKRFPAYRVPPGGQLSFEILRRGDPEPAPDQLSLERSWWLDFDGSGLTIHDRIQGTMSRSRHLAMAGPNTLGRASVDGENQLITLQGDTPPLPGIQLRRGKLNLEADSRLPRTSANLPAVGWDHDFQQVTGTLNLPPGWTLFSATGVDVPPSAWLQRWTLLDFFLVLIIAVSTFKLRDIKSAALILVTLTLIFHEFGAPRQVWLHLLAAGALLRYLPNGWFKRLSRLWGAVAFVALVVTALPFMIQQVRVAIYPQLSRPGYGIERHQPLLDAVETIEDEIAAPLQSNEVMLEKKADGARMPRLKSSSYSLPAPKAMVSVDPDALIQTGPGLPDWQWTSLRLRWNGPVDRHQQIGLWLISPLGNLLLGLVRVVLLLASIWMILDLLGWRGRFFKPLAKDGLAAALLICCLAQAMPAKAVETTTAFPPQSLLDELRQRLLEPPPCHPTCADISRLEIAATPDQLRLILQAHALCDTAIPLPITQDTWRPNQIVLNNTEAGILTRDSQGHLWIFLPKGVHRIKMVGPTADVDEIRIAFPIVPHMGTFAGVGWRARGFLPNKAMEASISLSRVSQRQETANGAAKTTIPAYFHVTRTLHLGIQWEVTTHILRLTRPEDPVVLSVPLLENASLTTDGILVQDQMAQISMAPNQTEARFSSTLPVAPAISLTAPANVPWTETWALDAAPLWRCTISGLTAVAHRDRNQNWQPRWQPWPGETVTINVTRPEAVPGRTITIEAARLTVTPGQRFTRSELTLDIRASKGGQHGIELPEMANLQAVSINDRDLPIRQDGQKINIPLDPGLQQVDVDWIESTDSMNVVKTPLVHIGDAAVNATVSINMPDQRWILLVGGPRLGPAVLFWGAVIVVIIVGIGLGKTDLAPLGPVQWVLLGLGLTQIPAPVAVLVAGWLLALGLRQRKAPFERPFVFNLTQLLLVMLSLAALGGLYTAVEQGLLGIPDMQIAGNHSTQTQLNWYQDLIKGALPTPWVFSLPRWTYHLAMLFWALWLAFSLVGWLRWGWGCFSSGRLWIPVKRRKKNKKDQNREETSTHKVE